MKCLSVFGGEPDGESSPSRGTWIEMVVSVNDVGPDAVVPLTGDVD